MGVQAIPYFSYLFILLALTLVVASEQTIFVSIATGTDSASCGNVNNPCGSILGALEVMENSEDLTVLSLGPGMYVGPENSEITLPDAPLSMRRTESDGAVVIQCNLNAISVTTGISAFVNLELNGVDIEHCTIGVSFNATDSAQTLSFSEVSVSFAQTGVAVYGGRFAMSESSVTECYSDGFEESRTGVGIYVYGSSVKSVEIVDSFFNDLESHGVVINGDLDTISISNTQFIHYGEVLVDGGDNVNGIISNCTFSYFVGGSQSDDKSAISIHHGAWQITDVGLDSSSTGYCTSGIYLESVSCLMNNVDIYVGISAIYATGGETTVIGGSLNVLNAVNFVFIDEVDSGFELQNVRLYSGESLINVTCADNGNLKNIPNLVISDCSMIGTGRIDISCPCDGEISNTIMTNITSTPYFKTNSTGTWSFTDVTIENNGRSSFQGIVFESTKSTLSITDSSLNGFSSEDGSAVYFSGQTLSVTTSTFTGNEASSNGGAIYLSDSECSLKHVTFSGNSAHKGSAIYCGGSSSITKNDDVTLEDNNSKKGSDITCLKDDDNDSSSTWWIWLIVSLASASCFFLLICVIFAGFAYIRHRKHKGFDTLDVDSEFEDEE